MSVLRKFDFRYFGNDGYIICIEHPSAQVMQDCESGDLICPKCGLMLLEGFIGPGTSWRDRVLVGAKVVRKRKASPEPPKNDDDSDDDESSETMMDATSESQKDGDFDYFDPACFTFDNEAVLKSLEKMSDSLNLPEKIRIYALTFFQKLQKSGQMRSYTQDARIAACLYFACRHDYKARVVQYVSDVAISAKTEVDNSYKRMMDCLDLHLAKTASHDLMPKLCQDLNLPREIMIIAWVIADNTKEIPEFQNTPPLYIAAAAAFVASYTHGAEYNRTTEQIATFTGVVPRSIKSIYDTMLQFINKLLPAGIDARDINWPNEG